METEIGKVYKIKSDNFSRVLGGAPFYHCDTLLIHLEKGKPNKATYVLVSPNTIFTVIGKKTIININKIPVSLSLIFYNDQKWYIIEDRIKFKEVII